MFHGRFAICRFTFAGFIALGVAGCQVPGHRFGGEALQFRFARMTNETIRAQAQTTKREEPRKLRRSAEAGSILLVGT